jgi:competence protein ComEC
LVSSRPQPDNPHALAAFLRQQDQFTDPVRLRGWVRIPPESFDDWERFTLEAESIFRDAPVQGGVQVSIRRGATDPPLELRYGQRIEFLARVRRPHNFENPGSFDWVGFLAKDGIDATASVRPGVPLLSAGPGEGSVWEAWVWDLRIATRRRLQSLLPSTQVESPGPGILRALLLGERAGLDQETKTGFQRTGTYHALVISGMHIGVVAFALLGLLRLTPLPALARSLLAVLAVAAYALLVGGNVPVSRAAWMFAAYLATALIYRQRRALNVLALAALGFLVWAPDSLFDAAFQLSFVSVGLIAGVAVPLLEKTLDPYRRALTDIWNLDLDLHLAPDVAHHRVALRSWLEPFSVVTRIPRNLAGAMAVGLLRGLVWAGELLVVSAVIQAGLALPMAVHFQRVSPGGLTANMLVVPLTFLAVPIGLAGLAAGWPWAVGIAERAAAATAAVVSWHEHYLPIDLRVPPPPLWLGLLFGLSLVSVAFSFERGRRWQWSAAAAFALSLALLVLHPFPHRFTPGRLELSALDVGQGESLFLSLPDGKTMLLDGGGLPTYGEDTRSTIDIGDAVVSPYLWSRSVKRLDVVAVSHPDADHMGGIPAILENFDVGEVWIGGGSSTQGYASLFPLLEQDRLPVMALERGDVLQLGAVTFEALGPEATTPQSASLNERSLVLRARYGRHSFLLTGDIERQSEARLIEERLLPGDTVLKVAHHGSRTSSQERFLERVRPAFALISAGFDSPFGHPHRDVLQRLEHYHATVLRTDLEGVVTVGSDGQRLYVSSYRRERTR